MSLKFYILKIKLVDSQPEIWRQIVVPATLSLDRLHDIIQITLGWNDCHLYQFTIGKKRFTEFSESAEDGLESGEYRLCDLVKKKGQTFHYCYDFGDDWLHEILVENTTVSESEIEFPVICLDGARACPPEDIGGIHGYENMLQVLQDPAHEEYSSMRDWLEDIYGSAQFDSEFFDINAVNMTLMQYLRWSRERYHPLFASVD